MTTQQCPLAYPDKFHAAAKFWKLRLAGAKTLSQENQLLLYALNQQATVGPNTTARPWGWNVVESTKWQGWKELGNMTTMEAMRLFVRTLDDEQPDWWVLLEQNEAKADSEGPVAAAAAPAPTRTVAQRALLGLWTHLEAATEAGKRPMPRYESAAAVLGGNMYVLGGNYGGRYLSDLWALDLAAGTWSPLQLQPAAGTGADPAAAAAAFPPTAGHTVTVWNGKLYVLGGHTKAKGDAAMVLRVLDPAASTVAEPVTSGQAPSARGGHTATLLGNKLWVIGGEDSARRALSDVHVLDLDTLSWSTPEISGKAPLGRSASCATAHQDRYIVIFGGGSVATCFSDLHMLDTHELTWTQLAQAGAKVTPRAGHAGAVLGGIWYIVGGGNNVKGCTDLLAADLSGLPASGTVTWHVVTSVALRDPLSSEGISLVVLPSDRVLVAFGGYNGKYQNTVNLFRAPEGSAALLAGTLAAAAEAVEEAKAKLANGGAPDGSAAAELRLQVSELRAQLEGARSEAETAIRESAAAKESAAHELALLRKQLTAAQASLAESNKALEDTRSNLSAEQSKVLKLEAQVAELQAKLGQLGELEREMEKYRRAAREAAEKEAASKKGGGFWGYIAGSSGSS
ncbi:hypothetical protein VOLCADRAFT_121032 [Volvox carteri f. nagariensis]|uniref:ACB domain-containing protein n=1 Tax=Volvox carteri f. nagariensis TaxID=3068 RepID=D8TZR5_VOLCA|nr:uncharacterized protein VOLCADRAFT_121032 [Volvox carteri f. nagariensis]EFJ47063.1 hypothetical protein VOLCADRAFT_121032 [Volvox carteri f. nagariensis]|eukprot:XP_002951958.1 hypothetical protein VOLCADRAFT_121032 [Volvox carteri f. nagariensis]